MKHKLFLLSCLVLVFYPATSMAEVKMHYQVPNMVQAPTGKWGSAVFRDACEETAILMAMSWVLGRGNIDRGEAEREILAMADLERTMFGFHQDTSAADTALLMQAYFSYQPQLHYDIGIPDIKTALSRKELVLVPIDGSKIKLYRRPPPRHMVVVTGFDENSNAFFIHDPLIAKPNIAIPADRLQSALRDYPSGVHKKVPVRRTAMLTVAWPWLDPPPML